MSFVIEPNWRLPEAEDIGCSVYSSVVTAMVITNGPGDYHLPSKILRLHQFSIYCADQFCSDYQRLQEQEPADTAAVNRR